jgi:molecular chaperone DnaK
VNQADTLIYSTEKSLKEFGDKVTPAERANIEAAANDLRNAVKDKNLDRIKKGVESLTQASHKLAEEIYRQATAKQQQGQPGGGGQAGPGPTPEPPGKDEDIVDAEVVDDDDKGQK